MSPGSKRLTMLATLSALSALVIHQVAYLAALPFSSPDPVTVLGNHNHLAAQWALTTPIAVLAAAAAVVSGLRRFGSIDTIDHRRLAIGSASLFAAQEVIEAISHSGGISGLGSMPSFYLGLLAAPLVALIMARAVHTVSQLAARLLSRTTFAVTQRSGHERPVIQVHLSNQFDACLPVRGPPSLLHH